MFWYALDLPLTSDYALERGPLTSSPCLLVALHTRDGAGMCR